MVAFIQELAVRINGVRQEEAGDCRGPDTGKFEDVDSDGQGV
jgi:hypothetical protein